MNGKSIEACVYVCVCLSVVHGQGNLQCFLQRRTSGSLRLIVSYRSFMDAHYSTVHQGGELALHQLASRARGMSGHQAFFCRLCLASRKY